MAVYTQLSAEQLGEIVGAYDVGELVSAKGIAEGVSNSNWLIETRRENGESTRFILTMYELRIELDDLPFFLGLLDHLAEHGAPVPRTIHDRNGAAYRTYDDKAVALIEFLPGVSVDHPTPAQAHSVGAALAEMHLAAASFDQSRTQSMGLGAWDWLINECGEQAMAAIDPELPDTVFGELSWLAGNWPGGLPSGVCHCDLFPDNVLMLGDEVSGMIDFYFAANDFFAYDLAVTHAAWCFEKGGAPFRPDIAEALLAGYQTRRTLTPAEADALPALARGACMRFISSRAYDWINTPADALVAKKDPRDFTRRLQFYRETAHAAFPL